METPDTELNVNLPKISYIGIRDVPLVRHRSRIRCGYYTSEWVARAMGMHPVPFNDILSGHVWLDIFRPILPRDMMVLFKFRGLHSVQVNLHKATFEGRINWIKKEIALKRKPLTLLLRARPLHWIVICGYDDEKESFYVYDSMLGSSSTNPFLPIGNNRINYNELIHMWRGRFWLKYRAIAITDPIIK